MTLKWSETAHDCRVAEALAPGVLQHFWLGDDRIWRFRPGSPRIRNVRNVNPYLDDVLIGLGRELPETTFWKRTRQRLITRHGTYQIRREVTAYVARGMICQCWGPCRYPDGSPVTEHSSQRIPSLNDVFDKIDIRALLDD